jgi:quercetin 2,3-dioxygenase
VAAPDGSDGAVTIHQDASLYVALLAAGRTVEHAFAGDRYGWVQVARGSVAANSVALTAGDGAAIQGEDSLAITASTDAEVLLFDLG